MLTRDQDVEKYCSVVADLRGVLENLKEFVDTLPAPSEDANVNIDWGFFGSLQHMRELLGQVNEVATELSDY
jgi:hypothetical protein